ncbi:cyclin-like protein [Hymenopellis radicata]|nr:cyclin-like protein [Hymenopellis radicata]
MRPPPRDEAPAAQEPKDPAPLNQWLFPLSALLATPSSWPLEKELYDRARGVEFLFRLGSSLQLPAPAMFTAATWFHRFYMRFAIEDFHRQDVAASCIFLATKTEECGRKLRDVARVCQSKIDGRDVAEIPEDSKEVENCQSAILQTEEVLLEALCFDFRIDNPHSVLVDLFTSHEDDLKVQETSWTIAHDSYRTPLCVLFPPRIIAAACYILAQRLVDGPNAPSLDARISYTAPSASLPTPPSHKPLSPESSRFALEHFAFTSEALSDLAECLSILLEFYGAQDLTSYPYLANVAQVPPPTLGTPRSPIYKSFVELATNHSYPPPQQPPPPPQPVDPGLTPKSTHGAFSPLSSERPGANGEDKMEVEAGQI